MSGPVTMLAAVHLPPAIGVPVAAVALLAILWQGLRLSRPEVPRPRRRVRRSAAVVMAVIVGLITAGASFIDPSRQPTAYVLSWSLTLLMLVVLVGLAALDGLVSSWLIRLERDGEAMKRGLAALAALEAAGGPRGESTEADADADEAGSPGDRP